MTDVRSILDRIYNPVCGILNDVKRISTPPGFPRIYIYHGEISSSHLFEKNKITKLHERKSIVTGVGLNEEDALWGLVGEAIERYCGANVNYNGTIISSYNELNDKAVTPESFIGYKKNHTYNNIHVNDIPIRWIKARSFLKNDMVWIPAASVWWSGSGETDNIYFPQNTSSGLAAGSCNKSATLSAICELIERDCFMSRWLMSLSPMSIEESDPIIKTIDFKISDFLRNNRIKCTIYDMRIDHPIPCVLAKLTLDDKSFGMALGACAHPDEKKAIEKAVLEAIFIFLGLASKYGQNNIPDLKSIRRPIEHGRYYSKHKNAESISYFFNGKNRKKCSNYCSNLTVSNEESISKYLSTIKSDAYIADLTTRDAEELNLFVIKCIVPGMQPITFGSNNNVTDIRRLNQVSQRNQSGEEYVLTTKIHPFA